MVVAVVAVVGVRHADLLRRGRRKVLDPGWDFERRAVARQLREAGVGVL
jgi:hypothetical protein